MTQFYQAFPRVSTASDKRWGEKAWVQLYFVFSWFYAPYLEYMPYLYNVMPSLFALTYLYVHVYPYCFLEQHLLLAFSSYLSDQLHCLMHKYF